MNEYEDRRLDIARLWSGGLATAVVAGLVVLVAALVIRGILRVPALAPEGAGYFGDAGTGVYAATAALTALLATGLLHLLLASAPRPLAFFTWIVGLAVVVATVTPFTQAGTFEVQMATALVNLITGTAIITLLGSVGSGVRTEEPHRPAPREAGSHPATGYSSGYRDALNHPPTRGYGGRHRGYDPDSPTRTDWN